MSFYEERILPWLIHLSMRQTRPAPYRGRVVSTATGRVLEVGIGSGFNVPFYGRNVNQIIGLEPSPKLLDMAHKAARQAQIPLRHRLEKGYMRGPKPMTFMYEGSARPD